MSAPARLPGTPLGGEHKKSRFHSPLQEMDGINAAEVTATVLEMPEDELGKDIDIEDCGEVKDMFKSMMHMMKSVKVEVSGMKVAVDQAKLQAGMAVAVATKAEASIAALQKTVEESFVTKEAANQSVAELRIEFERKFENVSATAPTTPELSAREATVVFTGLDGMLANSKEFIDKHLENMKLPIPLDAFHKGETFKGVLHYKFDNHQAAAEVIKKFDQAKVQYKDKSILCKADLPVEQRVPLSFILGLRRLLLSWGFDRKNLKVNDAIPLLSVGGDKVVSAHVEGSHIHVEWFDHEWASWDALQSSPGFKELIDSANTRLGHSAEAKKGRGKGYKGPPRNQ